MSTYVEDKRYYDAISRREGYRELISLLQSGDAGRLTGDKVEQMSRWVSLLQFSIIKENLIIMEYEVSHDKER